MSKFQIRWLALYILFGILISGCTPGLPPGAESTSIETITLTSTFTSAPTSTITPTPTPVPTATPAPVRLKKAIEDGVFGKIAEVGKGHILESVFSPEGSIFVAVLEHEIYIFNANTWEEVKYIPLNQDVWIYAIAFSKDGKALAFGDSNGMITIWNTETLEIEKSINSYESAVFSLDFSPDGKNLVSFGTNQIRLWNLSDGSLIGLQQQKFRGNIHYSEDGAWIISDLQGTNVWSAKDLRFIKTIKGSNYTQVVSPFSNIVARISEDLTILNFDMTGKTL